VPFGANGATSPATDTAGQSGDLTRSLLRRILADPKEPTFYTNRAMARLRMDLWDRVVEDCEACLALSADSMKAHYYLAQAHLALHNYEDALEHALKAHALCREKADKSLENITQLVLRCKKERWEDREKRRKRENQDLEAEVVAMLERERDKALGEGMEVDGVDGEGGQNGDEVGSKADIAAEWEQKIEAMKRVFDKARVESERKRKVPDWAIDDISFAIMVDPVVVSFLVYRTYEDQRPFADMCAAVDEDRQVIREGLDHGASA
jgi:STIP1 homology and U-box containing protein 1